MGRVKALALQDEPFTYPDDGVEGSIMQELKSNIRAGVEHTTLTDDQFIEWLVLTAVNMQRGRCE